MNSLLAISVLGTVLAFGQQFPMDYDPTHPSMPDLGRRLSSAEYVVVATVKTSQYADLRMDPEERQRRIESSAKLQILPSFGDSSELTTLTVDRSLCQRSDFLPTASAGTAAAAPSEVSIFLSRNREIRQAGGSLPVESLIGQPGLKYLLFLQKDPQQEVIVAKYDLDPKVTYYCAYQIGTIPLPTAEKTRLVTEGKLKEYVTPFLSVVREICEAVKADNVLTKMQNLQKLKLSGIAGINEPVDEVLKIMGEAETRTRP